MNMSYKSSNPDPNNLTEHAVPHSPEPEDDLTVILDQSDLPGQMPGTPVQQHSPRLVSRRMLFGTAAAVGGVAGTGVIARHLGVIGSGGNPKLPNPLQRAKEQPGNAGPVLTLDTERGTITAEIVGDGVARITILDTSTTKILYSYAVEHDLETLPATVTEKGGSHTIRTDGIEVTIDSATGAISASSQNGLFLEESSTGFRRIGDGYQWQLSIPKSESCHGLGQRAFPLSLRGRKLQLWNRDAGSYKPGDDPLYLNVPFYLGHRPGLSYGIFWDNPARGSIDLDSDNNGLLTYENESRPAIIYLLAGDNPQQVVQRFAQLTGTMELPPLWTLGYHQTRWSYRDEAHYREIATRMRSERIPCDALHFDIDYMDGFRVFTWDTKKFPKPSKLLYDLNEEGFKAVAIINPGVKVDPAYPVYQQGRDRQLFLKDASGGRLTSKVWADTSEFPDFTKKSTRSWWASQVAAFSQAGFSGLWNDMNEPATFTELKTLPDDIPHDWEGENNSHAGGGHSVYGMQMARASREGLAMAYPDQRPFVMSRAGYAGLQRFATTWNGDSLATWGHLRITIPQLLNLSMSGVPFSGSDIGGFRGDPDAELYVRWMQMASMTPFFRTHSARTAKERNPWSYGAPTTDLIREAIELRYRLLPYFYTLVQRASADGAPIVRPMFFEHPDKPNYQRIDDQFMLGDNVLVAPILERGAKSREVLLPAGDWYRFENNTPTPGERPITDAAGDGLPLYVRGGSVLPTWPVRQSSSEPSETLILTVYVGSGESQLYEDSGDGFGYRDGTFRLSRFVSTNEPKKLAVEWASQGDYKAPSDSVELKIFGLQKSPTAIIVDGKPAEGSFEGGVVSLTTPRFKTLEVQR